MATVGTGEYTYEMVEHWAKLPAGWRFGLSTGVTVDSQGRVYVCQQQQDPPLIVFDREGNYLNSWGSGTIIEPHTIYIGSDDVLYLADRGAHVAMKFTLDGKLLLELGNRGQPSDTGCTEDEGEVLRAGRPFNRPTRLFPSPSGDLYVSDGYRNSCVHRFSSDGSLIESWGTPGPSAPAEFRSPHSIYVDWQGQVYVCDRLNNRIQIFSRTGEFIGQWTDVGLPTDIYITPDGTVYVQERRGDGNESDHWISVRDKAGNILARWDTPRSHQTWVDPHGDIYMAVSRDSAITKCIRQR